MAYEDAIGALDDPTRRLLLERLTGGPLSVGELADGLPISRPAVSQHLRVLREAEPEQARVTCPQAARFHRSRPDP